MSKYLPQINVMLFIVIAGQLIVWFRADDVQAQTFLKYPFYGNPPFITASFDHMFPTRRYNVDNGQTGLNNPLGVFMFRDGNGLQNSCPENTYGETICYDGHSGIDFDLNYQPVLAAAAGVIEYAGWAGTSHEVGFGLMIRLDHQNGYKTIYGHLSAIIYQTGENINYINRWQSYPQIGTSGNSGSGGSHLHFGVLHNGIVTDPYGWQGAAGQDPWENHANGTSSTNLWASNAVQPHPPEDGPLMFDDGDWGFSSGCASASCGWNLVHGSLGKNNDFRWVYSNRGYGYWAKWNPYVPIQTQYELQVYIPNWQVGTGQNNPGNLTHAARYGIFKGNRLVRVVTVDQHKSGEQWVSLGRLEFNRGMSNYVIITEGTHGVCNNAYNGGCDRYNEGSSKKVVVDAMRAYAN